MRDPPADADHGDVKLVGDLSGGEIPLIGHLLVLEAGRSPRGGSPKVSLALAASRRYASSAASRASS